MTDLSAYTDEELMQIAGEQPQNDLSAMSDAELMQIAGISTEQTTFGQKIGAGAVGALDLATFGLSDEIMAAGMAALDPNQQYSDVLPQVRGAQEAIQQRNPKSYLGGQVVGGIAPTLAAAPLGITKGVTNFATRGLPQSIATGAGVGGISGGVYGFGSGEGGIDQRTQMAKTTAAYGAGGGVAGAGAGALLSNVGGRVAGGVGRLTNKALRRFKPNRMGQQAPQEIVEQLGKASDTVVTDVPKAYGKVGRALKKDFGDDLDLAMDAYKRGDMSLAELYGKRTESLAEAAALYPAGREVSEKYLAKTEDAYKRVIDSVKKNISGVDNFYTNADDLLNAGRAKARPLYEKSYEQFIDEGAEILQTPEIQSAIKKAYREYPSELDGLPQNSVKVLDYAKRSLDDVINKAQRAGRGNFARSRVDVKNQLLNVIDDVSPDYKQARAVSGDYLSINQAMDDGLKAFKQDSEVVGKTINKMTSAEKDAYKIGFGKLIRNELTKRDNVNPYKKILGSPEKRSIAQKILSPNEYTNFERSLMAEDKLFKLRNRVLSGSPTAYREEAKAMIAGAGEDIITGIPRQTFMNTLRATKSKILDGINEKTAAKVADILYETDPIKKLQILNNLGKTGQLTKSERQLVQRTYSVLEPKFDILNTSRQYGRVTGGATAATMPNETVITVRGNE